MAPAKKKGPRFGPGATIGIMGGGQLGRMSALAAASLGFRCHVFVPERNSPAAQVSAAQTVAPYEDQAALKRFARAVDLITFEFENIPLESVQKLADLKPVRPGPEVLRICQNRLREKDFCARIGVATTRYQEIGSPDALTRALRAFGLPAVLKTIEMGYDGKGQVLIRQDTDPEKAWRSMVGSLPGAIGILEGFVDFRVEISVVVARGLDGALATYPPVENQHRNHILDQTIAPARIPEATAERAEAIARHLAEEIGLVGVMGVEMFVTQEDEVLVNELAPRPHNSGHWTIDACATSQFEQFVRAIAGLPLGSSEAYFDAVMKNLIGAEVEQWRELVAERNAKLHLYGKAEARPGRKMGHVTRLHPRATESSRS